MVLEQGVLEGRRTFGNIIKYIKMTASSNFGNMGFPMDRGRRYSLQRRIMMLLTTSLACIWNWIRISCGLWAFPGRR